MNFVALKMLTGDRAKYLGLISGLTDFLSVLDAQRELYANEDLLAQSRTAQTVNLIALYKALGGGWQSFAFH